jgi:hypothetical protein
MARLRPDLFIGTTAPSPGALAAGMTAIPDTYHLPLVHFVVGYAEAVDAEAAEGSRAAGFMASFLARLTGASA